MLALFSPLYYFLRYHLKDVIVGKIYFLLVRIKIKHMEIDIIKRETTGTGPSVYHENDTIAKYEIMDGAPVRGKQHWLSSYRYFNINHHTLSSDLFACTQYFRGIHSHPVISGRLRSDSHHARHQQEVLCALLPEPGVDRRGGATIFQTAGTTKIQVKLNWPLNACMN